MNLLEHCPVCGQKEVVITMKIEMDFDVELDAKKPSWNWENIEKPEVAENSIIKNMECSGCHTTWETSEIAVVAGTNCIVSLNDK